jgi:hypothetical protein
MLVSIHNFRTTKSTNYIAQAMQKSNRLNLYDATSILVRSIIHKGIIYTPKLHNKRFMFVSLLKKGISKVVHEMYSYLIHYQILIAYTTLALP